MRHSTANTQTKVILSKRIPACFTRHVIYGVLRYTRRCQALKLPELNDNDLLSVPPSLRNTTVKGTHSHIMDCALLKTGPKKQHPPKGLPVLLPLGSRGRFCLCHEAIHQSGVSHLGLASEFGMLLLLLRVPYLGPDLTVLC